MNIYQSARFKLYCQVPVEKTMKSGLVYQILWSCCKSYYVGQTTHHLQTRVNLHRSIGTPVGNHFKGCGATLTMDDVKRIATSTKSVYNLMTFDAQCIRAIKTTIDTKGEYKSRTLVTKILRSVILLVLFSLLFYILSFLVSLFFILVCYACKCWDVCANIFLESSILLVVLNIIYLTTFRL